MPPHPPRRVVALALLGLAGMAAACSDRGGAPPPPTVTFTIPPPSPPPTVPPTVPPTDRSLPPRLDCSDPDGRFDRVLCGLAPPPRTGATVLGEGPEPGVSPGT